MKIGVYAGTFDPWHRGHFDILKKALKIFDKIIIAVGQNPDKPIRSKIRIGGVCGKNSHRVNIEYFDGLLVNFVKKVKADAVIRGLRNGADLQYEMNQQYWNEDLGLEVPIMYFICDRKLSHISSSMIRQLEKIKK